MIFVTTGTQAPFDRLIQMVDEMAPEIEGHEVIAQAFKGTYIAKHIQVLDFLEPKKFKELFDNADLIISHAGMGTVISALTTGKTLIIVPRNAKLGEHRNDHQLATARKLDELNYVHVAFDSGTLVKLTKRLLNEDNSGNPPKVAEFASGRLISSLRKYIHDGA